MSSHAPVSFDPKALQGTSPSSISHLVLFFVLSAPSPFVRVITLSLAFSCLCLPVY